MQERRPSLDVLLIEDSPGDVRLARQALSDSNLSVRLHVASDGIQAVSFLRKQGRHVGVPRPDLILARHHQGGRKPHDLPNGHSDDL